LQLKEKNLNILIVMATIKKSAAGLDRAEKRENRKERRQAIRNIRKGVDRPAIAPMVAKSSRVSTKSDSTPALAKSSAVTSKPVYDENYKGKYDEGNKPKLATSAIVPKPKAKAKAKSDNGEGKAWTDVAARIKAKTAAIDARNPTFRPNPNGPESTRSAASIAASKPKKSTSSTPSTGLDTSKTRSPIRKQTPMKKGGSVKKCMNCGGKSKK
jgi:hypothetical protein